MKGAIIIFLALVLIFVGPWLTWLSLTHIINTPNFGVGNWFAALWLMIVFGGVGAATK